MYSWLFRVCPGLSRAPAYLVDRSWGGGNVIASKMWTLSPECSCWYAERRLRTWASWTNLISSTQRRLIGVIALREQDGGACSHPALASFILMVDARAPLKSVLRCSFRCRRVR